MTTVRRLLALVGLAVALGAASPAAPAADAATRAQRIVSLARVELAKGVREIPDGSNRAPAIRRYVASTSPSWFGAPWCAYFVSYVARRAGVPIGPQGRGLGYVPYIVSWARRTGRWTKRPRPGYLVTWPNHVGIVETVTRDGRMTTIEGNAGNAVRRRWRRTSDAQGFVRLAAGGAITPPRATPRPPARRPSREEAPLRPRITLYPSDRVRVGDRLELSANDSSGPIERVRWDFDADGRFDDARGDTATLRVTRAGRFRVAVRLTSPAGRTAVGTRDVTVLDDTAPRAHLVVPAATTLGTPVTADASRSKGTGLRFEWDLDGDGGFVGGMAKQRTTFAVPGVHQVTVRVHDADGDVDEASVFVTVAAPAVGVSCASPTVPTGTDVRCSATTEGIRKVSRVEWDTDGDGVFAAGSLGRTLRFPSPGTRTIRVRVVPSLGEPVEATTTLEVLDRAPVAALKLPGTVRAGAPLALDASGAKDPDGTVVGVRWDVGADGTWDATGVRATVPAPSVLGVTAVRVEVTDAAGAVATADGTVTVVAPLVPVLTVLDADPVAGSPVLLTARDTTGGPLKSCAWDWTHDGRTDRTSTDCALVQSVTYRSAGARTVAVKVTAVDGAVATATARIIVR